MSSARVASHAEPGSTPGESQNRTSQVLELYMDGLLVNQELTTH